MHLNACVLPSSLLDGSASSTQHTWSTDETRNTNTNVQSDPPAPSLPTNSGVNQPVPTLGQSSQVFKQQTSLDSVTEVDKGTTLTHPQTHRPAVVSTPASTSAGHPLHPTKPASVNSPNTSVAALPLNSSKLPHVSGAPCHSNVYLRTLYIYYYTLYCIVNVCVLIRTYAHTYIHTVCTMYFVFNMTFTTSSATDLSTHMS